jgi:hypothetical protein
MIDKIYGGLAALGAVGCLITAAGAPQVFPAAAAGTGGLLAGASLVKEASRKKSDERDESTRVAAVFSSLYQANQGLVSPQQLSLLTAVDLERISEFLNKLAEAQGGNYIEVAEGGVFSFPHPANVLQQLTDNANAWVRDSTAELQQQNMALQQQSAALQQQVNMYRAAVAAGSVSPSAPREVPAKEPQDDVIDPWTPSRIRA